MTFLQTWIDALRSAFENIGLGIATQAPKILAALVIVVVGWFIGSLIGRLVAQIIRSLKIDQLLRSAGVEEVVKRSGHNLNIGKFIGVLVEWFIIVAFMVGAFNVLELSDVNFFLQDVLNYLPRVIIAVLILVVGVVVADVMRKIVLATSRAAGIHSANFLGAVTRWAIWIFALLTALVQLNIAVGFINTLFTGVIVALSLAFGLAFGLGGQDAARQTIEKVRDEISHKA